MSHPTEEVLWITKPPKFTSVTEVGEPLIGFIPSVTNPQWHDEADAS